MEQICSQQGWVVYLAFFVYAIIEAWMGKNKFKANSVLEFVAMVVVFGVTILWERFHWRKK